MAVERGRLCLLLFVFSVELMFGGKEPGAGTIWTGG